MNATPPLVSVVDDDESVRESLPDLLSTYVDPHATGGPPTKVVGSVVTRWSTWTDGGGDTALAAQRGQGRSRQSLLVFGTVSRAQLEVLAASGVVDAGGAGLCVLLDALSAAIGGADDDSYAIPAPSEHPAIAAACSTRSSPSCSASR